MSLLILAGVATLMGGQDLSAYEGVARDDFAAWSFTSGSVTVDGDARTTSVLTRYVTPEPFSGGSTLVAYSIHSIRFHCTARTADWVSGANYAENGAEVGPASPATAQPWSESTPGFTELATQVCALSGSL